MYKSVDGRGSEVLQHFAERDPPTFEAREAAEYLHVGSATAARLLSVLVARGWLTRHRKGVYEIAPMWASPENPFDPGRFTAVGHLVRGKYYVGFRSAFEIRDWLDHPVRGRLWIAVPSSRHTPTTLRDQVTWVVLRRDLFSWGIERHWVGTDTIWVSDPERTILDALHLPRHAGGITEIVAVLLRAAASLNGERLVAHTDRLGNESVRRRLGFLLETLLLPGLEEVVQKLYANRSIRRRSPVLLDPTLPTSGPIDARWGVRINVDRDDLMSAGRT